MSHTKFQFIDKRLKQDKKLNYYIAAMLAIMDVVIWTNLNLPDVPHKISAWCDT